MVPGLKLAIRLVGKISRTPEASVRTVKTQTPRTGTCGVRHELSAAVSIAASTCGAPSREAKAGCGAVPENERKCMSGRPRPAAEAPFLSAAQLRQIIDGATDTAIISIDRGGFVTRWSRGAQRI